MIAIVRIAVHLVNRQSILRNYDLFALNVINWRTRLTFWLGLQYIFMKFKLFSGVLILAADVKGGSIVCSNRISVGF